MNRTVKMLLINTCKKGLLNLTKLSERFSDLMCYMLKTVSKIAVHHLLINV